MAFDTWNWDKVTGSGMVSDFRPCRHDPLCVNDTEAGYEETRPQDVKGRWFLQLGFSLVRPSSFIYLVNFHFAHRGGLPFYFRWPWDLAGLPDAAEAAVPGGMLPWDSEVAPGAGEGPTFLVYWAGDEFPVKRISNLRSDNYWAVDGMIELRQI